MAAVAVVSLGAAFWWRLHSRGAARGANVLVITIDTLRADHLGAYGDRKARSPHIDALARRGLLFEHALSSVPLTLPSHSTILSGLEPIHHGVHLNGTSFPTAKETLATLLQANGYATGAFVGSYVLDRRFGLGRGFDEYDDRIERAKEIGPEGPGAREYERPGGAVADAAVRWIGSQAGPFLAWVHFYDPHAPYEAPSPYRQEFAERPYDGEVAYTDECVGRVLAAAEARGAVVVALLADHGEGLDDHGERTHGFFLYESTLHVPLILAGPGIPTGARRADLARTVDVLPTLLALVGVTVPKGLDGHNILRRSSAVEAYAETLYPESLGWAPLHAIRRGSLKYIDAPRAELYDVAADAGEATNLFEKRTSDAAPLRDRLYRMQSDASAASVVEPDPDVADRLRALGYVGGSSTDTGGEQRKDPKDALEIYRAFEDANFAEGNGRLEAAIAGLRSVIVREPGNVLFRRSLGSALQRAGRNKEALIAFDELVARVPNDAISWHERSKALEASGRLKDAVESAERAVALKPSLPGPQNHLGVCLARTGKVRQALAAFERALALDPNNAQVWSNRANAHWVLGERSSAREGFERARNLAPTDPDPVTGLGVMSVEDGQISSGIAYLRRALELSPSSADIRLDLAMAEQRNHSPHEARKLAEDVLRDKPSPAHAARARELLRSLAGS